MSRYSYYKPYVPVAKRREQGHKAIEKLRKKGIVIEPLGELSHRSKIATSFWGGSWCKHLESFSDYDNRLPRGRTYVRNGSVLHLAIQPGEVKALVQGSSLYEVNVTIQPLAKGKWKTIQQRCQGGIGSLIELLQGKISDEIMTVVTNPDHGLFPKPSEIKFKCSCPDWATMCKHVACVLYGVGAKLDTQPELLFKLRGVDHTELISPTSVTTVLGSGTQSPGGRRRSSIDTAMLNDVFGIELEAGEAPISAAPAKVQVQYPSGKESTKTKKAKSTASKSSGSPAKSAKEPFVATSASVRSLREQLGLSRAEFAAKLGVSSPAVYLWETKGGPLNIRATSLARLQALAR